jgi:uncharacterized heparinase superfamily protein
LSSAALYFHTLRHLRAAQILARLRLPFVSSSIDVSGAPPLRQLETTYKTPIAGNCSMVGPSTFRFLNVDRDCCEAVDWEPSDMERLWIYNLHYFDDLNARDSTQRMHWHRPLLDRWIVENPVGRKDAWDPYPLSRRIVNWIKWSLRGNELTQQVRNSLALQARWLMRHLEYHILGNHLLANAKALVYAGLFFSGPQAETWYTRGLRIFEQQLREQVADDGGHFELSPMYHATVLEDLLDLINLYQCYDRPVPESWRAITAKMFCWLRVMSHPDGRIAFFNDSAFDIAPDLHELERYAQRVSMTIADSSSGSAVLLRDSGYVRLRAGPAYLICDCGPIGPDYQPGHAHADTLSFELSLHSHRVFVNSGTSCYGTGPERQRQRATASHNTVVVDGQSSSEVWAGFRVGRRARAWVDVVDGGGSLTVSASHDGYRRLKGRNTHLRRWQLRQDALLIEDELTGHFENGIAFFYLHPEVEPMPLRDGTIRLRLYGDIVATVTFEGASSISAEATTWHPAFGTSLPNHCLQVHFAASKLRTLIEWGGTA